MPPSTTTTAPSRVGLAALVPYLREHVGTLLGVVLLSLVTAVATLAQPLLIRQVLDAVAAREPVGRLVLTLVLLLIAAAAVYGVRNFLLQRAAEGLVLSTRRKLTWHLLRLPITTYDQQRTGDLLSRAGADTTLLRSVVTSGLLELASGVVIVGGAAVMMVIIDPLMFGVTLLSLAGLIIGIRIGRRVRRVSELAQTRIGEMTSALERAVTAVRTIRASRAEERETALVQASAEAAYAAGVRMARLQALIGPVVTTVVQGAFLAVLGVGGARVAAGAMTVGDLVAFVIFLFLLVMPIGQAMNAYAQLQVGLGALQRIEEVLRLPIETAGDPAEPPARATAVETAGPLTEPPARATAVATAGPLAEPSARATAVAEVVPNGRSGGLAIEFDRVSFAYATGERVLHEVSFQVPYGSRTALVGPSGAGKSTVLTLVERFYDVADGAVRVAGVDVREQPRHTLRGHLGYVEQEAPVLAGTIRDNLLLATPDAADEELLAVLAAVNLGDLVERTPLGLDAPVGEGGVLLSGGERQRLAIARTLLAKPPILLLDEPTSNLDARNEHALRQAIDAAAARRTLLVVAHRLATVVDADQIVVLDQGRVVAIGTHAELTETNPLYRELATHQLLVS